jgi:hypothetical protein
MFNLHSFCAPVSEQESCEDGGALERSEANSCKNKFSLCEKNYEQGKGRGKITFRVRATKTVWYKSGTNGREKVVSR